MLENFFLNIYESLCAHIFTYFFLICDSFEKIKIFWTSGILSVVEFKMAEAVKFSFFFMRDKKSFCRE